ncbi:MAG TPA: protein phosphatase 2C domain-containing protein [Acidobacteriaceae bacterium]|jgi:protein phosphatase|nr:protein phosphatase 2C domain-containing protein [Acidobacteriaceae bacterium]
MLDVVYGQASDTGRVWPGNADAAAAFVPRSRQEVRSRGWLFAVADGRGGTELGAIASARAVETMIEGFGQAAEGVSLASLMPRLVQRANAAVHDEALSPERRGRRVATTIVSCALRNDSAFISHVGDSRCYHVRDHQVTLLTHDHTWTAEQQKSGATSGHAEQPEKRHLLTRSLGPDLVVTPETGSTSLNAGDLLVLCTDGLYEAMYPEDIARIVSQNKDPAAMAKELVTYAVQSDGSDNATVQVIQVRSIDPVAPSRNSGRSTLS